MLLSWPLVPSKGNGRGPTMVGNSWYSICSCLLLLFWTWASPALCMSRTQIQELKAETEDMFYHGFNNYMKHAFPEDELRPLSCAPLSRDRENPSHIELNDVLGNYSLTLIDSLSTLAILASSSPKSWGRNKALDHFQNGIRDLVKEYGDGSDSSLRCGRRSCGFDLDSKVQVFETVIRGVGGLLSAHLFAVGELPIRGYTPPVQAAEAAKVWDKEMLKDKNSGIRWSNGFVYNGQLLRLAYDLGSRMLPAFWTSTGIPYPRVNLRDGIPFYANSPYNYNPKEGQCDSKKKTNEEITETCSAGAGSLVLEFTVLSRLTGDSRFEDLGKRAFWSIWSRRSDIGLIGAGIDAENGQWVAPYTGIGAGIDSFFEYALKSHILLSRDGRAPSKISKHAVDPRDLFENLAWQEHASESFLHTWLEAHAAIKRHLWRGPSYQHPHYIQGDVWTGATRAFWIDSLSAYYPGLLILAGELEEAIEAHLLTTALWTRYSGLPERWNAGYGDVEGGLGWWGGRPEFIESNWYIYQATKDPWYLYVAEMVLRDIKRRCWTKCGWAGLQDVKTGELNDRMESFFLGETAKYLFLTFDLDHPLNHLDAPFVFTTEGHPLIIPFKSNGQPTRTRPHFNKDELDFNLDEYTCPVPPSTDPFVSSYTASRKDLFHAATLAKLDLMPERNINDSPLGPYASDGASITVADVRSPSNYTYFPWTLPPELVPVNATSSPMMSRPTLDISFPRLENKNPLLAPLQRVKEGIFINSISGLRLGMIKDTPIQIGDFSTGQRGDGYRIQAINNLALGRDEKVYLAKDPTFKDISPDDPVFTRVEDVGMFDLVLDVLEEDEPPYPATTSESSTAVTIDAEPSAPKGAIQSILDQFSSILQETKSLTSHLLPPLTQNITRYQLSAMLPIGLGSAPVPNWVEAPSHTPLYNSLDKLSWTTIYVADEACNGKLPRSAAKNHQIIIMKRGGCSFSEKLANIPSFAPSPHSLQLVIVVSYEGEVGMPENWLIRPVLDKQQFTSTGLPRHHPILMVLVGGGHDTYEAFRRAVGIGYRKRYTMEAQGVPISNLVIL